MCSITMGNVNKKITVNGQVTSENGFILSEPENEKVQQIFFHNLNEMVQLGLIEPSDFDPFYEVTCDGRKMIVLPFSKNNNINIDKLNVWNLVHKYPERCEIVDRTRENTMNR